MQTCPSQSPTKLNNEEEEQSDNDLKHERNTPNTVDKFAENLCLGKFSEKLMAVLSREDTSHAIQWLPDGRSFVVVCEEALKTDVLGRFFKGSKIGSFTRKLRRWGFKRSKCGKHFVYSHELFLRDEPNLCTLIKSAYTLQKGIEKGTDSEKLAVLSSIDPSPEVSSDSLPQQSLLNYIQPQLSGLSQNSTQPLSDLSPASIDLQLVLQRLQSMDKNNSEEYDKQVQLLQLTQSLLISKHLYQKISEEVKLQEKLAHLLFSENSISSESCSQGSNIN